MSDDGCVPGMRFAPSGLLTSLAEQVVKNIPMKNGTCCLATIDGCHEVGVNYCYRTHLTPVLANVVLGIARNRSLSMNQTIIQVDPDIQGGNPVFAGTRVPVKNLFDYLKAGESIEVFLEDFPSVPREVLVAALEQARKAVAPDAHIA